jgi:outer membrane protein
MRVLKSSIIAGALTVGLSGPALAQTAPPKPQNPPATTPKPQTPPATTPSVTAPAAQAPARPLEPPAPFPQDSKIAFVDVQAIASNSQLGKAASAKLQDAQNKRVTEINDKNKQLQTLTQKRDAGGGVLNDAARAQLDKDIDKLQREIQFDQQNAQAEMQEMQNELQGDFQKKLIPIIQDLAKEKGLYAVFAMGDSGVVYWHAGLDISEEVVKRLDASTPKKTP